jgi:hypothetical protein
MTRGTIILVALSVMLSAGVSAQEPPEPWPNDFEGNISVNGERVADREIQVFVGGELEERVSAKSGSFEALVSGDEGDEIEFFTEDRTGELVNSGRSFTIGSFGESRSVEIDFSIEDPEPRVDTGDVVSVAQRYAVVEASTSFFEAESGDLYFEYGDTNSESRFVDSAVTESFNLTGLEPDTEYDYTAFLDLQSAGDISGSERTLTTEEIPGLEVEGETNLEEGFAELRIDGELVENTSIEPDGGFESDIQYEESYEGEEVDVEVRDSVKTVDFESGLTEELVFNITDPSPDLENDTQLQGQPATDTAEPTEEEDSGSGTSESDKSQTGDDVNPQSSQQASSEETSENTNTGSRGASGTGSTTSDDSTPTGSFTASGVNGTTLILSSLIAVVSVIIISSMG